MNFTAVYRPFPTPIPAPRVRLVAISATGQTREAVGDAAGRIRIDLSGGAPRWDLHFYSDQFFLQSILGVGSSIAPVVMLVGRPNIEGMREVQVSGRVNGVDFRQYAGSLSSFGSLAPVEQDGTFRPTGLSVPSDAQSLWIATSIFTRASRGNGELLNCALGSYPISQDGRVSAVITPPDPPSPFQPPTTLRISIPVGGMLLPQDGPLVSGAGLSLLGRFNPLLGDELTAALLIVGRAERSGTASDVTFLTRYFDGPLRPEVFRYLPVPPDNSGLVTEIWIRDWSTRSRFDVPNVRALGVRGSAWTSARIEADFDRYDAIEVTVGSGTSVSWRIVTVPGGDLSSLPLPPLPPGVTWRALGVTDTVSVRVSAILRGPPFAAPWSRRDRSVAVRVTTLPVSLAVRDP